MPLCRTAATVALWHNPGDQLGGRQWGPSPSTSSRAVQQAGDGSDAGPGQCPGDSRGSSRSSEAPTVIAATCSEEEPNDECKVTGTCSTRGRSPVIDDLLVGREVLVGQVGFHRWLPESRVFDRAALEGGSDMGRRDSGQTSRSDRGVCVAVAWCPVWKAM
jgi:hypothetical protein